jgi:thiamine-phosphate pyrophosphorylase
MPSRQARPDQVLPRFWLMTDERMGDRLWQALDRLPDGAGIVFRHYATPPEERRALFARIAARCASRRLILIRAGDAPLADREDGVHGAAPLSGDGIRTWPAHDRADALAGVTAGADLLFASPVFATRSHPGAPALGADKAAAIVGGLTIPAIALGGMTCARFAAIEHLGFYGWAGIDAWLDARC